MTKRGMDIGLGMVNDLIEMYNRVQFNEWMNFNESLYFSVSGTRMHLYLV